ncbi:MAG TPA: hypothetical protein VK363_01175 [Pyrinomonadaceae bacterium]|nr:hypothetical protein [Pyrinomonadaceae bacterium]
MSDPNVDTTTAQDAPAENKTSDTTSDTTSTTPEPTASQRASERRDALRDAFLLGAGIVELKNRVQIASHRHHHDSGLRLASVWRASFNRIAALQIKAFETSTTAQTLYEPPDKNALPYLHPGEPDYADVGITGVESLKDFKLYDVTRRAINCLTLLYVKEEESLVPAKIKSFQDRLVTQILKAAEHPEAGGGDPNATEDIAPPPQENALEKAKAVLSERVVKFLDAWDGYLRENFYAGGKFQNDDLELVAYESGHSVSSFSWGIAAATEPLEHDQTATEQKFIDAWKSIFKVQNVNRLQHQISALSSELDDAYYLEHPEVKRISANDVLVAPNPDLPSQSIRAVKNSIDYWQRTVEWIPDHLAQLRDKDDTKTAPWSNKLRLALAEQSNIWQTLLTGQQTLRAYNMESVTHQIMQEVTAQIQNSLRTDFYGSVQQAQQTMKQVADEVKDALDTAKDIAVVGVETLFGSFKRWLLIIVIIIVAIFVGLFLYSWADGNQSNFGNLIGAAVSAVAGWLGLGSLKNEKAAQQTAIQAGNSAAKSKVDSQAAAGSTEAVGDAGASNGFLSSVQGAAQQTGTIILNALERGYKQARIELDSLSRSVAVSYPLVEFFGINMTLEGDVSVLTDILWGEAQRDAEIERVTRAAFGPLSVFILSSGHSARPIGDGAKQIGDGSATGREGKG